MPRDATSWALGELKQVTVLIADIVSSTELVSNLDPEQAMERLRPAIFEMCNVVERFDGTVLRTLGDGVMGIFGAPRAHEGHALLGCEAAMFMQQLFARRAEGLQIRVGLHSGEVVSEPRSTDRANEQNVHGLTIHLASRIPAIAEPGTTCLTDECYRLVRSYCDVSSLGQFSLKGISRPVEIYRLLGLKAAVASQPFRSASLSSLRGRDRELSVLQRTLGRIDDGNHVVIGIAGAPGTGKSRLCYEFARWCRSRLIPVFEARAQPYGHATPLQPVLEFLRSLFFGILPSDSPAVARSRIADRMAESGQTSEADLYLMHEFLGVPDTRVTTARLNPRTRHARLLDIVRHLVRHGGTTTSVIIMEDLHWLDEASEDFVAALVDAVPGTRTMLVLNYRPSHTAKWMQAPHYEQLLLAELSPAETAALVEELIGSSPDLDSLRSQVAKRSGGNPFFAEELVRSLADSGVLSGAAGDYAAGAGAAENALPATVQAVIGARIDHLGESEKTLLQVCAIIGKEISLAVLQQVADRPLEQVETALDGLCRAELIQLQSSGESQRYAFRHPLIQEVAYGTQLKARRAGLHALVAAAMEQFYHDRLGEYAALLAYHFEAAGQLVRAAQYAASAAMWIGSTDTAQAIKHWHKVRLLMQDQPGSKENDGLFIMASAQVSWLGWREGLTADEARPYIDEALRRARKIDDTMIPMLLFVQGRITVASGGSADTYVDLVKEALSLLQPGGDSGRRATLNACLSHALGWSGLLREALWANDRAMDGISSIGKFDSQFLGYSVEHWAVSLRGRLLVRLGQLAEAQECFERMMQVQGTLIDPTLQIIAHLGYVDIAWCQRNVTLAEHHASRMEEIADRHASPYLRVFAFAGKGIARSIANDFGAAILAFRSGLEFIRRTKAANENEAEMLASLAECEYQAGAHESAASTSREAIELARQRTSRLPECRAMLTLAGCTIAQYGNERIEEAQELVLGAERLIGVSGVEIYEPLLRRERARLAVLTP